MSGKNVEETGDFPVAGRKAAAPVSSASPEATKKDDSGVATACPNPCHLDDGCEPRCAAHDPNDSAYGGGCEDWEECFQQQEGGPLCAFRAEATTNA